MSTSLPAIVKAGNLMRAFGVFGVPATPAQDSFVLAPSGHGIRVTKVTLEPIKMGDKKVATEETPSDTLAPNQRVVVTAPLLHPSRYHFLVTYNPDLLRWGSVSCPGFYSYKELQTKPITMTFTPYRQTDILASLAWIFEIIAID